MKLLNRILGLILISILSVSAYGKRQLPPILNFYPNCEYKVLKNESIKLESEDPLASDTTALLLAKLRKRARGVGAEAIILESRDVNKIASNKRYLRGEAKHLFKVKYQAKFINLCKDKGKFSSVATPYDESGYRNKTLIGSQPKVTQKVFQINFSKKSKLIRPTIDVTDVSTSAGIYGVNIGDSYMQVTEKWGKPSVVLDMGSELIVGYGRKHWLHFQHDKLVKLQTYSPILSKASLNEVPLLDFFDDNQWQINSSIKNNELLSSVLAKLPDNTQLSDKNKIEIVSNDQKLTLHFRRELILDTQESNKKLDGFSIEKASYQQPDYRGLNTGKREKNSIENQIAHLINGVKTKIDDIGSLTDSAFGRIFLTESKVIDIHHGNLLITHNNNELEHIMHFDQTIKSSVSSTNNHNLWKIGNYVQDGKLYELRKYFPEDAFELDGHVQIDRDTYQLSLYFDENNALYEAKISLF